MIVKFDLANKFKKTFITINTDKKTVELENLRKNIQYLVNDWQIQGYQSNNRRMIPIYQIIRFYTESKNVVCETTDQEIYRVHQRIYELNRILPKDSFIQASSSELVNINSIYDLSLTKTGTYQINLTNGKSTYTSRRYMKELRKKFLK